MSSEIAATDSSKQTRRAERQDDVERTRQPPPAAQTGSETRTQASRDVVAGARQIAVGSDAATRGRVGAAPDARATGATAAAATGETHDIGDRTLQRGSKGDDVKGLQEKLNAHGAKPPLDVDGKFGPLTQAAVNKFQRDSGMRADGQVGPRTREALKKDPTTATTGTTGTTTTPTGTTPPTGTTGTTGTAPVQPASGSAIDRNKAAAQNLLNNPNVRYWGGLSTGSDRKALEQIARTGQVTVPHSGQTVTPKPQMMEALQKMAQAGPLQINALTGGTHSTHSHHYNGTAVDLANGLSARQMQIARENGGRKNNETSHAHIDF